MSDEQDKSIVIALPSLIHRIGKAAVKRAQLIAMPLGCELKRVRRSRNWVILGDALDVQRFTQALKQHEPEDARYVINKLEAGLLQHADKLEPLEVKLIRLVRQNPAITLGELIEQTHCTLAQARLARFDADV